MTYGQKVRSIKRIFGKNTLIYDNESVDTAEAFGIAFSNGEEGHEFEYAEKWETFIGTAWHLIQQTGGTLFLNDMKISAIDIYETNGKAVNKTTQAKLADGRIYKLGQLLNLETKGK
jgi:hypothetical protein